MSSSKKSTANTRVEPSAAHVSGFCNPYNQPWDLERHGNCPVHFDGGPDCTCACHRRFAAFWINPDGDAQMEPGWESSLDARRFLDLMAAFGVIAPDAVTDVDGYVGECPW